MLVSKRKYNSIFFVQKKTVYLFDLLYNKIYSLYEIDKLLNTHVTNAFKTHLIYS